MSVNEDKIAKSSIMERALKLQEKFCEAIDSLPTDVSSKRLSEEIDFYGRAFDELTNELIGSKTLRPIITELLEFREEHVDASQVCIDDNLLNYVEENTDTLMRKEMIKQCHATGVECLICEKPIIGLGLMDWVDCGTNAVCFKCIDKKQHYIGGGIYFTKFA